MWLHDDFLGASKLFYVEKYSSNSSIMTEYLFEGNSYDKVINRLINDIKNKFEISDYVISDSDNTIYGVVKAYVDIFGGCQKRIMVTSYYNDHNNMYPRPKVQMYWTEDKPSWMEKDITDIKP